MLALDHEITALAYLSGGYLTVIEGLSILRDLTESRRKVFLGCVGEPYDYNVFSVPAKNLVRSFVSLDGRRIFDRHPPVAPWWMIIQHT